LSVSWTPHNAAAGRRRLQNGEPGNRVSSA
jgi:hypothetical protein